MYKVESQSNKLLYRLQDFTKSDNVDESVFFEAKNSKGSMRLQCNVKVLHDNEYDAIIEEVEQANLKIEHLNAMLNKKNNEIKRLEGEIDKLKRDNKDENEKQHQIDIKLLKETHEKQLLDIDKKQQMHVEKITAQYKTSVDELNDKLLSEIQANKQSSDKLKDEMLDITKQHVQEVEQLHEAISTLKQEHLKEINKLEKDYFDKREEIRTSFLNLITNFNSQDITQINEIQKAMPFPLTLFARKAMQNLEDLKEKKQANTPEKIIKTYELAGE